MKKTKKINLSTTEFPEVTSLNNLEVGKVYKTKMYAVLIPLMFNRGVANGIVNRKVLAIKEMIKAGKFYMNVVHVEINLRGQIIDGHHRYKALKEMGLPVNFIINMQPEFNCDDPSEILNNVSEYNEINSSWTDTDAYLSALGFNEPAAMAVMRLKQYVEQNGVKPEIFTPARIIALATKFDKGLAGKKQKRVVYCSQENADIIDSAEFYKEVDQLIELVKYLGDTGVKLTPWFFVRAVTPIVWDGYLSFAKIFAAIKKDGLSNLTSHKAGDISKYVNNLAWNVNAKRFK